MADLRIVVEGARGGPPSDRARRTFVVLMATTVLWMPLAHAGVETVRHAGVVRAAATRWERGLARARLCGGCAAAGKMLARVAD